MTDRTFTAADGRRYLVEHDLLGHLEPEELEALLACARVERFGEGGVLFREGDPGDKLFAVLAGRIMIGRRLERGKVDVLNVLGQGRIFGEIALLDGGARAADAVAITEAHLLVIEHSDFIAFLKSHRDVAPRLIAALCQQVRRVSEPEWYEAARIRSLAVRLARKLLLLASVYGEPGQGGVRIDLKLSQEDLGRMTGVSRESINKQLRNWQHDGLIATDAGTIVIRDPDQLRRIIETP